MNSSNSDDSDSRFENYRASDLDLSSLVDQELKNNEKEKKNPLEQEYYANLELPYGSGFDEIKASYKRLLKKYHPDKFYGNEKKIAIAQDVVKKLNVAYNYFEKKYNN